MLTIKKTFWSRSRKTLSSLIMASALVAGTALSIPAIVSVHAEDSAETSSVATVRSKLSWGNIEHAKIAMKSIAFTVDGELKYYFPDSPNVDLTKYMQYREDLGFVSGPVGAKVTLKIVPDEGYEISSEGNLTSVGDGFYTFVLGDTDATVTATVTAIQSTEPSEPSTEPTEPSTEPEETPKKVTVTPASASENDRSAAQAVTAAIAEVLNGATSTTGISEGLATKIAEAVNAGMEIIIELSTKTMTEASDADTTLVAGKKADKAEVLGYYDIDLVVKAKNATSGEVTELGNVTELNTSIVVSIDLSEKLAALEKVADGEERIFEIVRVHNGVASKVTASLDANNVLSFSAKEFSTYAVTYRTVAAASSTDSGSSTSTDPASGSSSSSSSSSTSTSTSTSTSNDSTSEEASAVSAVVNPSTADNLANYIIVGLISLAGLVGSSLFLIRRPRLVNAEKTE